MRRDYGALFSYADDVEELEQRITRLEKLVEEIHKLLKDLEDRTSEF